MPFFTNWLYSLFQKHWYQLNNLTNFHLNDLKFWLQVYNKLRIPGFILCCSILQFTRKENVLKNLTKNFEVFFTHTVEFWTKFGQIIKSRKYNFFWNILYISNYAIF